MRHSAAGQNAILAELKRTPNPMPLALTFARNPRSPDEPNARNPVLHAPTPAPNSATPRARVA